MELNLGRTGPLFSWLLTKWSSPAARLCGHHLFAQANSFAVALVDSDLALTKTAQVSYRRPVKLGDRVMAKAAVTAVEGYRYQVQVNSFVRDELVFSGEFVVVDVAGKGGAKVD